MVITSRTTHYRNKSEITTYRKNIETTIERIAKGVSKYDLLDFTNCIGQGMHKS
jgi:hypothetical protein